MSHESSRSVHRTARSTRGLREHPRRHRRLLPFLLVTALTSLRVFAPAYEVAAQISPTEPLAGLDAYVESSMRSWDAPGVALVVVRGDDVLTRGYGVTAVAGDPVDEHTLFGIGSLTKAFTATVLAMLVDEGRIAWDDAVSKHLPGLVMRDPYVTRHLTIRDVLSHRTGLAGDDLMWVAGGRDAAELIHSLRFQEPAFGFRAGLGYHNVMYLVAGELATAVAGKPWNVLVHERIFEPLGMGRSVADPGELRRRTNVALPHDEIGPGQTLGNAPSANVPLDAPTTVRRIPWFDPVTAPAGGIASSAADFGQWLRFQLGAGEIDGTRVVSEEALLATRTPQVPSPGFPRSQSEASETNLSAYGMGWGLRDYRGRLMVSHLGSTPGWGAAAMLLPTEDAAVAVFANTSHGLWLADAVARWIVDRLLGAEMKDWNGEAVEWAGERRRAAAAALEQAAAERVAGTRHALPLEAYAGTYVDSLYPAARVTHRQGALRLVLGPQLAGALDHWQDDVFRVTWERPDFGANFVTFEVGDRDHPEAVKSRILGREATWRRSDQPPG
ncbi:MAG TPA: serine hydrolase [Longimicrobiales bacterium]|nr:serine hydrolase [Longimicrobiales bacterium]